MTKKVLVVGGGGRENALGYGINASASVDRIYFVPGNGGTAMLSKGSNIELEQDNISSFCLENKIDLVVIGPDAPVVAGLADKLRARNITVFGPSKVAAQLEGSKAFATEFMQAKNIPLPLSRIVKSTKTALNTIESLGGYANIVIKADGLAGGKGVFLPDNEAEAKHAVSDIFAGKVDGVGDKLVIQQRYHGPEVSVFVLSDGENYRIIPIASQDHKRILAGDKGPMTGGMGVYAPLPKWMLSTDQWGKITSIASKTIKGMRDQGNPYQGVLYMGLMLAEELDGDPIVIEYNARFGDPETEVIIPLLLKNGVDVYDMLMTTANGLLAKYDLPGSISGAAITICLASAGYPGSPQINKVIHGLDKSYKNVILFHGSTKKVDDSVVSASGRVIFVTGFGPSLKAASSAANAAIGKDGVHFDGMQYRKDIGHRAFRK